MRRFGRSQRETLRPHVPRAASRRRVVYGCDASGTFGWAERPILVPASLQRERREAMSVAGPDLSGKQLSGDAGARVDIEPGHHQLEMVSHRVRADGQAVRYLIVRKAFRHE